jgi:hypothetical protein
VRNGPQLESDCFFSCFNKRSLGVWKLMSRGLGDWANFSEFSVLWEHLCSGYLMTVTQKLCLLYRSKQPHFLSTTGLPTSSDIYGPPAFWNLSPQNPSPRVNWLLQFLTSRIFTASGQLMLGF